MDAHPQPQPTHRNTRSSSIWRQVLHIDEHATLQEGPRTVGDKSVGDDDDLLAAFVQKKKKKKNK